ncbi:response regulator [Massilia cavernae]|uniref:DNA-binding response regulator n=1 Tax=Massilia cavernae TaxID=2320864 RepID=A0A418XFN5_9BURK|nr:response regulator transcription factor [Massilia cavernae]RJG11270.1 DNA-binding response regulator [Massilia cavernae]
MRILLVEDDVSLGETILAWLRLDQYAVDWVRRGDSAETALMTHAYDCVLLDRGLPGMSGDRTLERLRARGSAVPVLMITAFNTLAERVEGLDIGADGYLIKPFDLDELSARIRAAVRRKCTNVSSMLQHGSITLDAIARRVRLDQAAVDLTPREYNVLYALMQRKDQITTRAQIEESLYGWGDEIESNAVEVYIHSLRRKLGAATIVTIRGLGYRLNPFDA